MQEKVKRLLEAELRWPRSLIQRPEELSPGRGFQWAAERVKRWIEVTAPDGHEELLQLIQVAEKIGCSASDSIALTEEARRIWYLYLKDVMPQRAVARLYEALVALAAGNQQGFVQGSATAVFIVAASESYTEGLFLELEESYRKIAC
jgi:hypothetical protein